MSRLKARLESIRVQGIAGHFIPEKLLSTILTSEEILKVLDESRIPHEDRSELVKYAIGRGQKIFAILVQIQAVKKAFDFMSGDLKDIHIPLEEGQFHHVDASEYKSDFQRIQWEYIAPLWDEESSSHKSLRREVILPIVEERLISKGSFGDAYEITFKSTHQGFVKVTDFELEKNVKVLRKELRSYSQVNQNDQTLDQQRKESRKQLQEFKKEVGVLRLLRLSKHANIVQILGSYVQHNMYNLIFPLAQTDLENVLVGKWSSPNLMQSENFIDELRALASALNALHFYRCKEMELDLIGCHHDLKPNNILIFDGHLVLADFGVSRLAPVLDGSLTKFKDCIGDFFSPESLQDMSAQSIGRKSDIWSLGCVIVEVATFMVLGAAGVQEFRLKRETKISQNYRNSRFHDNVRLKPEVTAWTKELSEKAEESTKDLIQLTSGMLNVMSQKRPDIEEVLGNLNFISLKALVMRAIKDFEDFFTCNGNFNLEIERTRFCEWYSVLGLESRAHQHQGVRDDFLTGLGAGFRDKVRNIIGVLKRILKFAKMPIDREEAFEQAYLEIRQSNDDLWNALPSQMRKAMQAKWKSRRLMTKDVDELGALETASGSEDVMASASMKRIFLLMENNEGSSDNQKIQSSLVTNRKEFGEHSLGWYKPSSQKTSGSTKSIRVVIEWWSYTEWDVTSIDELFQRMNRLASLPIRQNQSTSSGVLGCEGYLHEEDSRRFGMICPFPEGASKNSAVQPVTLDDLIRNNPDVDSAERPLLENTFRLAEKLVFCVSGFHSEGWLHKNICGRNIVFFPTAGPEGTVNPATPYMIGFNHSRPDEKGVITLKPSLHHSSNIYQHPEYMESGKQRQEFCKAFDYYSLGVVLLEIGLWTTMDTTPLSEELELLDVFAKRDCLLKYAKDLGVYMGGIYRDAVLACLQVSAEDKNVEDDFHDRVVGPISRVIV